MQPPPADSRRVYYDHEPAYRKIQRSGGRGWDDLSGVAAHDSYTAVLKFLDTEYAPVSGVAGRALDLGCGGGEVALLLAGCGYDATGIDYSETAIVLARENAERAALPAAFLVGDCLDLAGLPDAAFDLVTDNHVLHCIIGSEDRQRFLRSVRRVLKPGGTFFSETMTCEGAFDPRAVGAVPETRVARNHTRYWATAAEVIGELRDAAFRILYEEQVPHIGSPGAGNTLVVYASAR